LKKRQLILRDVLTGRKQTYCGGNRPASGPCLALFFSIQWQENKVAGLAMENHVLAERVKELSCLYALSRLFSRDALTPETVLEEMLKIIPRAWQYPRHTGVRICLQGLDKRTQNYRPAPTKIVEAIHIGGKAAGFVEIVWVGEKVADAADVFLPEERKLLVTVAELAGNVLEKEAAVRALQQQKEELENKNLALKEIISHIGSDKEALKRQFLTSIEITIRPILAKLQNPDLPWEGRREYLRILEQNLREITSPYARRLIDRQDKLSPREIEICALIKNGLNNKEISRLLMISLLTVTRHRHNIRRKLDLVGEAVNLATYLRDL
jgi:DNA-binding CsgD family transcriptional regulator